MDQHLKSVKRPKRTFLSLKKILAGRRSRRCSCRFSLALSGAAQTAAPQQTAAAACASGGTFASATGPRTESTTPALCASCVRENLTYLAGPALHGRGSGTEDEHHAAQFIADKLKLYGLAPAAGDGQFIQTATIRSREVIGNPTLTVECEGQWRPTAPCLDARQTNRDLGALAVTSVGAAAKAGSE